ncbi:MAG: HAD-IC family P-type ATPase [Candidatus Pacebacteria bacterium]|nr:HAD-IC family P-type ATPase [Candidatus Paceibacterota bacterium]
MINKEIIKKPFWALPIKETIGFLETFKDGIGEEEAQKRVDIFGKNKIQEDIKTIKLGIFLNQLKSPLIFFLIIAGLIMILVGDYTDAIVILGAAIINGALGFYQENKAEQALARLKSYIQERTRVFRGGREYEVETKDLVPGDIIQLSQGSRVPADARIIYFNNLFVDESILTGEALPVEKNTNPVVFGSVIGDRKCMVFSGTTVVQGFLTAVVTATGINTELGRIASMVRNQREEKTPLQKAINKFSIKASIFLALMIAVIFAVGIYSNYPPMEMFFVSVAVMVSAVPEGLPVAMTVILAIGVQRLAKKNGIVRKLLAAETLGDTTIILTDKTGTLTEAKMSLSKISIFDGKSNKDFILKIALVNSEIIVENPEEGLANWRIVGRPMEVALVRSAGQSGVLINKVKENFKSIDFLPFNSSNKYTASVVEHKNKRFLTLMGAPEILLKMSDFGPKEKEKISKQIHKMALAGERILGMAVKELSKNEKINLIKGNFKDVSFLGTISFVDPIREGVRETIQQIEKAGIKTVIVTGDHRGTAEAVAKSLGFDVEGKIIDGNELDLMSVDKLKEFLPFLRVVSRVSPEGKLKIAKAYQEMGEVVAMTGDGVNDAPSLKQANIGVAMGSGTDVAKDVADLVLLDNNFKTIVSAIEEGRRIISNIRKALVYLLSDLVDELFLIGGSLVLGIGLPLNAIQILWVNFFTDSFPAIALAFEDHVDYLKQKNRKLKEGLIDGEMKFLIAIVAVPTTILLFVLYVGLLNLGYDLMLVKTFIFAAFGSWSLFLVFSIRSLHKSIFKYNPFSNKELLIGTGIGFISMTAAIYVPFLQNFLETVSLPPLWLLGVIGVGILNILLIETGKLILRKKE